MRAWHTGFWPPPERASSPCSWKSSSNWGSNPRPPAPVLSSCDLLLQVSDHESFGLSSLEALACGIPVIGTSGSGLSEVVADGKNGLLSRPGDTEKMVRDAVSLLRDRKTWKNFSQHALRWSHNRFTAGKIVTEYEKCYRQLLNR